MVGVADALDVEAIGACGLAFVCGAVVCVVFVVGVVYAKEVEAIGAGVDLGFGVCVVGVIMFGILVTYLPAAVFVDFGAGFWDGAVVFDDVWLDVLTRWILLILLAVVAVVVLALLFDFDWVSGWMRVG